VSTFRHESMTAPRQLGPGHQPRADVDAELREETLVVPGVWRQWLVGLLVAWPASHRPGRSVIVARLVPFGRTPKIPPISAGTATFVRDGHTDTLGTGSQKPGRCPSAHTSRASSHGIASMTATSEADVIP
jgi:hypothetical protein